MQECSNENGLPRILQLVTRKDRRTSSSSSISSKALRRESGRRFHVPLSISSLQHPESEHQQQHASPVELVHETEVGTHRSEERLERPQPALLGERPESRTSHARDIPPTPPAMPPSQHRSSELSLTQRIDGMFRPVGLPQQEPKQTKEVRKGRPLAVIICLIALLATASICTTGPVHFKRID